MKNNAIPFYTRFLLAIGVGIALAVALDNLSIGIGVSIVFVVGIIVSENRSKKSLEQTDEQKT